MPRIRRRSIRRAPVPPRDTERAYLHHLVKSGETLGAMLLSYANVQFYQELMARAREAIAAGASPPSPMTSATLHQKFRRARRDLGGLLRGDVGGGTGGLRAEHLALPREEIEA